MPQWLAYTSYKLANKQYVTKAEQLSLSLKILLLGIIWQGSIEKTSGIRRPLTQYLIP
jgi:hypothetical protein